MNEEKFIEDCLQHTATQVLNDPAGKTAALIRALALSLKAERAKPTDDLWKNAPEDAEFVDVCFYGKSKPQPRHIKTITYTRKPLKTRIRELAEERAHKYFSTGGMMPITEDEIADLLEDTLLKHKAEIKEVKE